MAANMNPWLSDLFGFGAAQKPAPVDPQMINAPGALPIALVPKLSSTSGSTQTTTTTRATPVSFEDARHLGDTRDMLVRDYLQSFRDQQAGVEAQQQNLNDVAKYTAPVGVDLSPLLKLTDAYSGHNKTNIASGYSAPMSPAERAALLTKLDAGVQSQRAKLTTADLSILKTLLPSGNTIADKGGTTSSSTEGVTPVTMKPIPAPKAPGGSQPKGPAFLQAFRQESKDAIEQRDASGQVIAALESGSKVGPAAAQILITRASGHRGRVPFAEQQKFQGDPSVLATLQRAYQKAADGTLRAEDSEELKILARVYQGEAAEKLDALHSDYTTNRYGAYNIDQPAAMRYLKAFAPQPKAPAPAPEPSFSLKDIMQEYRKQKGNK